MSKFLSVAIFITCIIAVLSVIFALFAFISQLHDNKNMDIEHMGAKNKPLLKFVVRIGDIFFSGLSLLIISPMLLISSLLLKLDGAKPIIEKRSCIGKKKQPVAIYRFNTFEKVNDQITYSAVGKFLTRTGLSELPMIFNIFKGDLAFLGLARINYNDYDLINQEIPDFLEDYNNYKPGLVSLAALKWHIARKIIDKTEYFQFINRTNKQFIQQYSIKHLSQMMFMTIYLLFRSNTLE